MPHTLLLADDSVTIQRVIELTFADEDVQVVAVSDGDQAIERLETAPPDIVLADIGMPGRNGYEVARYMRQSPRLAHIPVVLLTGAFEPVDQGKADEVGCDGVLAKPFEPQLVIGRVKELLTSPGRKGPSDVAPAPASAPAAVAAFPVPAPAAASDAVADLDDYFDRLDSAFANRAAAPPPVHAAPEPVAVPTPQAPSPVVDWFSAPAQEPETGTDDSLPLTFAPPAPAVATPEPPAAPPASFAAQQPPVERSVPRAAPAAAAPPPEPVVPKPAASVAAPVSVEAAPAPAASAVVPALATAHVSAPQPAAAPAPTPRALPTIAEAFAVILEAEQQEEGTSARPVWPSTPPAEAQRIEELPEAVLEQITERVLARMSDRVVREMVAEIAERLVRDEIERIKSSLR